MQAKIKNTIIFGLLIIVVVSCGIFMNYKLDLLMQQSGDILAANYPENLINNEAAPRGENKFTAESSAAEAKNKIQSPAKPVNNHLDSSRAGSKNLINDVQKKVGQPVEKLDIIKASVIIMSKLSAEDISYLTKVAMKDSYTQEDYQHSQEILLKKLSAEDIDTLKKLGEKYGKDLKILYTNVK